MGEPAQSGPGVVPMTLAHNVAHPREVDAALELARAAGASVGEAVVRERGGYTGYFADPDGFRCRSRGNPGPIGLLVVPETVTHATPGE